MGQGISPSESSGNLQFIRTQSVPKLPKRFKPSEAVGCKIGRYSAQLAVIGMQSEFPQGGSIR